MYKSLFDWQKTVTLSGWMRKIRSSWTSLFTTSFKAIHSVTRVPEKGLLDFFGNRDFDRKRVLGEFFFRASDRDEEKKLGQGSIACQSKCGQIPLSLAPYSFSLSLSLSLIHTHAHKCLHSHAHTHLYTYTRLHFHPLLRGRSNDCISFMSIYDSPLSSEMAILYNTQKIGGHLKEAWCDLNPDWKPVRQIFRSYLTAFGWFRLQLNNPFRNVLWIYQYHNCSLKLYMLVDFSKECSENALYINKYQERHLAMVTYTIISNDLKISLDH